MVVAGPRSSRYAVVLSLLLWLAPAARAQETNLTVQNLTVQNLAPFARKEWASAVVPFARGTQKELPDLHVRDSPTFWQPIGARWPDGSLRQALCFFRVEMAGLSEQVLRLRPGKGPDLPKADIPEPKAKLTIHVVRQGKAIHATPKPVRILESNRARRVTLERTRVPGTGLVFEVILAAYAGQEHVEVDIGLFFSDPTTKAMQVGVDLVRLDCEGMSLVLRHAGPLAMDIQLSDGGSQITLLRNTVLGDGQGIRRTGVLVPKLEGNSSLRDQTLQAAAMCTVLAATPWSRSGAFGAYGFVPEPPPWLRGRLGRLAFAKRHLDFVNFSKRRGDPLGRFEFGLSKYPPQTGNQEDFGILKLSPVAATGLPSFLYEVELSVLQEACRPSHFFEADGSMVRARNHENWVVWNGVAHWNCSVSKDRLGKPCPRPKYHCNGWENKDREHLSSNYLCAYYLLTGKHWALREIQNEVQLFLAGQTTRAGLATSGFSTPRAAGRTMLAGCWYYLCTGDQVLLKRMHDRIEHSHYSLWHGRKYGEDKVRALSRRGAHARAFGGRYPYWNPWQESLAAIGYGAFWRLAGNERAREMAEGISLTVLRHGWLLRRNEARVGYQMKWNEDGSPLTEEERQQSSPDLVKWAGGGISVWSMGAVELASQFAKARGEKRLEQKAEQILAILRRGHDKPPADGWWDDYREWDAVR